MTFDLVNIIHREEPSLKDFKKKIPKRLRLTPREVKAICASFFIEFKKISGSYEASRKEIQDLYYRSSLADFAEGFIDSPGAMIPSYTPADPPILWQKVIAKTYMDPFVFLVSLGQAIEFNLLGVERWTAQRNEWKSSYGELSTYNYSLSVGYALGFATLVSLVIAKQVQKSLLPAYIEGLRPLRIHQSPMIAVLPDILEEYVKDVKVKGLNFKRHEDRRSYLLDVYQDLQTTLSGLSDASQGTLLKEGGGGIISKLIHDSVGERPQHTIFEDYSASFLNITSEDDDPDYIDDPNDYISFDNTIHILPQNNSLIDNSVNSPVFARQVIEDLAGIISHEELNCPITDPCISTPPHLLLKTQESDVCLWSFMRPISGFDFYESVTLHLWDIHSTLWLNAAAGQKLLASGQSFFIVPTRGGEIVSSKDFSVSIKGIPQIEFLYPRIMTFLSKQSLCGSVKEHIRKTGENISFLHLAFYEELSPSPHLKDIFMKSINYQLTQMPDSICCGYGDPDQGTPNIRMSFTPTGNLYISPNIYSI